MKLAESTPNIAPIMGESVVTEIGVPTLTESWSCATNSDLGEYLRSGVADLMRNGRRFIVAAPDTDRHGDALIAEAAKTGIPILQKDRYSFGRLLEEIDRDAMCHDAGHGLYQRDKMNSALYGIRPWQFAGVGAAVALIVYAGYSNWEATLSSLVGTLIIIMAALILFRLTCFIAGVIWQFGRTDAEDVAQLSDTDLPTYSILLPMLRERESTVRGLIASLSSLEYPREKLQVLFILEDTDAATRAVVDELVLPEWFTVILIPDATPHTKGKACNYAMNFVTGEYFTIYDAEDHPDPLQLKKAVAAFRREGPDVVCAQSRLNFYNVGENWLTRMFTLDYSMWYYFMLPGVDRLRLPICLGGTSNHFKSRVVRDLGVWDAYNVTEDADFGLRIAKSGYRTVLIDSVTYEEAVTTIPSWIRQRTRWIKGYMLTYLVHMRQPLKLVRDVGAWGFIGVQLFVAGNFVGNLIILPLLLVTILWMASEVLSNGALNIFPPAYESLALATLVIGTAAAIGFSMVAGLRRGIPSLALYALTAPLYWMLGVVATYRALWQIIFSPYKWEKTEHGVSSVNHVAALERDPALESSKKNGALIIPGS